MDRDISFLMLLMLWWTTCLVADVPTEKARQVAEAIRREVLLPPNGPEGRPLPLASHWNVGMVKGTFEPDHQIQLLQDGHHILPWMAWPQGDPESDRFKAYHERLLTYFARLKLPVSFRGTQWNAMLVRKEYREGPEDRWAGAIRPDGTRKSLLSPFGAIAPWRDPAKAYVDTPAMKRAQEIYPNPPRILWVSNNEPPSLRWAKHGPLEEQSKRYLDRYGPGRSDEFKRKAVAEGWMARYPVMFDAMRKALVNDAWRRNVRFVGYGAFGPSHFGRWDGWPVYSLITDDWTSPNWHYWQGGSPSYYTHNWNDNRDHWVFSTQVQSMNWLFMLEEAWKVNPDFWFEISTWDGNELKAWKQGQKSISKDLLKKSKALQYLAAGQDYPPERAEGWIQFGMWLLRPRVVREFRGHATRLAPVLPYWMAVVRSVDRVHESKTLENFWRHGELVPNPAHRHPYQVAIPEKYKDIHRWYLLDTDLDAPRPWTPKTNIPVFSLALVRGEPGSRQWLVYAHSPLEDRPAVAITLPGYGSLNVSVPRAGAFYVVDERARSVEAVPASRRYSWQQAQAKTDAKGNLTWTPKPFAFEPGPRIRYIDFENGDDSRDGQTPKTAWRHHPWDRNAAARAAEGDGRHTYVFKRGVAYRGTLQAKAVGEPGRPIQLTSDPAWGEGDAVLCGSVRLTDGWRKGAAHKDIPGKNNVWYRDLDFAPRSVWLLRDGNIIRIPLARMPNWRISDPEDVKKEWWHWDNPGHPYFHMTMRSKDGRRELAMGRDTKRITGPESLYMGAIIWAEFGWVDGTPYPSYVQGFDAGKNALGFEGYLGSPKSRVICRYHRYYLEDKPQYLDDDRDGEFWFEKKGRGGRLHIILPGRQDPNTAVIEAARDATLVDLTGSRHVRVSGLSFRFTNVSWNLTELPWQYSKKFRLKPHLYPACVRVWGPGDDIIVANCTFEHVNNGVLMKAVNPGDRLDRIVVRDSVFRETDHHGVSIEEGLLWGDTLPDRAGHLFDVKILRNYAYRTGLRSPRVGAGNAINVDNAETLEVAGNVVERAWHAGINVRGAKISHNIRDCPLSRILIYQNKVTDAIRTGDDCGNIETWQGGPAYVFNNVSGNPGGYRYSSYAFDQGKKAPGGARFGMAYYLDGSFKNYFFNNIGWGLSSGLRDRTGATCMFQEIISYQNMFFNNTAYRFVKGSRRQAPQAGRNKFLGNIWDGIGDWVFWHTQPAKAPEDANARDAGRLDRQYAHETNAFTGNVFHHITGKYAAFKSSGAWHRTFADAKKALSEVQAMAHALGMETEAPPMKDPSRGDFSLSKNSAAIDCGVKAFVPWPAYATVGEWHFYPAGDDPSRIVDEHWYMTPYYYVRDDYYKNPMFPLKGVNVTAANYVAGPLEDWTRGACTFNGRDQYAFCADALLNKTLTIPIKFRWDKQGQEETRIIKGKAFKSPQVHDSNFLIEVYMRTEPGHTQGMVCRKMTDAGYELRVNASGSITFRACGAGKAFNTDSRAPVNDGRWHHVVAECDREARTLTLYVDGRKDSTAQGPAGDVLLANDGDLYVAGCPEGDFFHGALEFLRISLGTLKDAKTDIDELYAWQFDGPFLHDFNGKKPIGKRDAGALEKVD